MNPTAPRFFAKFFQQAYLPLDRDIVREMWVMGGLKDELGIPHRRVRRRQRTLAEIVNDVGTSTVDSADNAMAKEVPPAEQHEMRPLSFYVTAPSITNLSSGEAEIRLRSPHSRTSFNDEDPEPSDLSDRRIGPYSRTGTDMSYYSAADIKDA